MIQGEGPFASTGVLVIDDDPSWLRTMRRLLDSLDVRRLYLCCGPDRIGLTLGGGVDHLDSFIVLTNMAMQGEPLAGLAVVEVAQRVGLPVAVLSVDPPSWPACVERKLTPVPFLHKYHVSEPALYRLIRRLQKTATATATATRQGRSATAPAVAQRALAGLARRTPAAAAS